MDLILKKLNIQLTKEAYEQLLREFDRDGSRTINFDEFLYIMMPVFTGHFKDDELKYAFKKFDADDSGYITADEIKKILTKIGQNFNDKEITDMIRSVDADSDSRLNFNGFIILIFLLLKI